MDLQTLMVLCFLLGYAAIAFEHTIRIHKSASALLTGVVAWIIFISFSANKELIPVLLLEKIGNISSILFFLLGAMTIVELIDAHDGFEVITEKIRSGNKRKLLWLISIIAFFLSALLDNMTTAIVMVSLIRKLVKVKSERWIFAGMIIIAANAGGSWSPIGDVTTTMLWIGKQITAFNIVVKLFLPALLCLLVPLVVSTFMLQNDTFTSAGQQRKNMITSKFERRFVFFAGIIGLFSIPLFKAVTHLPPYIGMLFALGVIWTITEIIHRGKNEEEKGSLTVAHALRNTDTPTILFFLGILLCISALESSGVLSKCADFLTVNIKNQNIIVLAVGLLSSFIDNVPLVAAVQGMYGLNVFHTDHFFWEFIAYAAGTGGSILIIGSAAGVAAMGMENINFFWYMKRMSIPALIGYFAGAGVYVLEKMIF